MTMVSGLSAPLVCKRAVRVHGLCLIKLDNARFGTALLHLPLQIIHPWDAARID